MKARPGGHAVHMVCPRLLELDRRHGQHLAGIKHPVHPQHFEKHADADCDCLVDLEGHMVTTLVLPHGSELADDHPLLTCSCGRQLVEGEDLGALPTQA